MSGTNSSINEDQTSDILAAIKSIVRRAIKTLYTLKDPDSRYRRGLTGSAWLLPVVNRSEEAYGYKDWGFEPTPHDISQMEIVAAWLAWLKRTEGEEAVKRIISWSMGAPGWMIGRRERCSERTIKNRIDRSVAAIINQFSGANISVEYIEDGKTDYPFKMEFAKPEGPHGGQVLLSKVYIYDKGMMIGSRRLRDGREKAEKFMS